MAEVHWRVHVRSSPERVWEALTTDGGRAAFWAESAVRRGDGIHWTFTDGQHYAGPVLAEEPPRRFALQYYGDSRTTFTLSPAGTGGTDVDLLDEAIPDEDYAEVLPGWVSVLMALKAYVDHGIDLRNHDAARTWDQRYCDN